MTDLKAGFDALPLQNMFSNSYLVDVIDFKTKLIM